MKCCKTIKCRSRWKTITKLFFSFCMNWNFRWKSEKRFLFHLPCSGRIWSFLAIECKFVNSSDWFGSAPFESKYLTQSILLFITATRSGVQPSGCRRLTSNFSCSINLCQENEVKYDMKKMIDLLLKDF
jgi:hypothetical protein